MPMLIQSPSCVPATPSRTWSTGAVAGGAGEDRPRASMMAAPRFCTVGMNVLSSQAWSLIIGQTFLPSASHWKRSGYWVAEWFPQTVIFLTEESGLPTFCATWLMARLWSRRIIPVNWVGFRLGALFIAIRQLVLAGLPTTSTLTLRLATLSSALPCGPNLLAFAPGTYLRS